VGYVLTSEELAKFRAVANHSWGCSTPDGPAEELASDVLRMLDHAAGLDSKRLHELATWARDTAREADIPERLTAVERRAVLSASARIVEISTDVLTALALDKLPAGAVQNIGRDDEQVNAKSPHLRWPDAEERAFMNRMAAMVERAESGEPDPGEAMFMRVGANLGLGDELAANGKMSRAQVEALPSHDRVVLGQILATLRGEPLNREPLDGPAVDVLVELDVYLRRLAMMLGEDRPISAPGLADVAYQAVYDRNLWKSAAQDFGRRLESAEKAPRYSLPETHPLRQYQWAEWLHGTLKALRVEVARGFFVDVDGRAEWLEAALERINALDVHGLRGLVEAAHDKREDSPLSIDENTLLLFACDRMGFDSIHVTNSFVSAGCHRVPRVRGETAEVGK
jgi:hypothetical protein